MPPHTTTYAATMKPRFSMFNSCASSPAAVPPSLRRALRCRWSRSSRHSRSSLVLSSRPRLEHALLAPALDGHALDQERDIDDGERDDREAERHAHLRIE